MGELKALVICDHEEVYADFLSKQLLRTYSNDLVIYNFTTSEQLLQYAKKEQITYSMIAEEFREALEGEIKGQIYWITTTKEKEESREYIYRYQSAERIYERLFGSSGWKERKRKEQKGVDKKAVGVYNPLHRSGQTTFAKALADVYGRSGKSALYLNLEEYSGAHSNSDESLAKLLYYLKQDAKSIKLRVAGIVACEESYDYIKPIYVSEELKSVMKDEWTQLLVRLQEETEYEVLVIDFDSCIQGFLDVLESCNQVILPVRESIDRDKIDQFLENLKLLGRVNLLEKITEVSIAEYKGRSKVECKNAIKKMIEGKREVLLKGVSSNATY